MSAEILHPFEALMRERIVVLDGAMGTMVQRYKLTEQEFRGKRFADWKGKDLKGSNEVLLLTKPDVIEEIHAQYLEAGADMIETNTFSATTIGLHDFLFPGEPGNGRKDPEFFQRVVDDPTLRALAHEMNVVAAQLAPPARRIGVGNENGRRRFVAGSLGPDAGDRVALAGCERSEFPRGHVRSDPAIIRRAGEGLLEGGVDLLLVETIFDT